MQDINFDNVAAHYSPGKLLDALRQGVVKLGKSPEELTLEDLAPADEFHIGGRPATGALLDQVGLSEADHVIDVGCGLGGTSRFIADTYGCRVDGIDLTAEFVEVGNELCAWVGMQDRVRLRCGNALQTGFDAGTFDAACMLHVGMNISDKAGLFREVARILRSGGQFAVYDILKTGESDLDYPVPWAGGSDTCAAAPLKTYEDALNKAGFEITSVRDRTDVAEEFFSRLKRIAALADGPPPLGLHLVLGEGAASKVENMIKNVTAGRIAPTEIIARKI